MGIIYGYSEAAERMAKETDEAPLRVALDHDFYTNNHSAVKRKVKEVSDAMVEGSKSNVYRKNNAYAMGGVVKERRGFFGHGDD